MKAWLSVADTRVSTAEFGDYHYQRFILWAFVARQSKAAFARNIIVSRVESNQQVIEDGMEFYASRLGLTLEQLHRRIMELDSEKLSIAQIHQRLVEEYEVKEEEK